MTASAEVLQLPVKFVSVDPALSVEELRSELRTTLKLKGFQMFESALTGFQNYLIKGKQDSFL